KSHSYLVVIPRKAAFCFKEVERNRRLSRLIFHLVRPSPLPSPQLSLQPERFRLSGCQRRSRPGWSIGARRLVLFSVRTEWRVLMHSNRAENRTVKRRLRRPPMLLHLSDSDYRTSARRSSHNR